jgi:thymidylate kinase
MSARQDTGHGDGGQKGGLLYRLRMVMLAWDRRALAARLHRMAASGRIVLCDRYPSAEVGTIDGAALEQPPGGVGGGLRGYLARLENRLYREIAPPDIVIRVVAPAETAVERNRQRREPGKEKSDDYVAHNHRHVRLPSFPGAHTHELNTNRPRAETVQDLRCALWQVL